MSKRVREDLGLENLEHLLDEEKHDGSEFQMKRRRLNEPNHFDSKKHYFRFVTQFVKPLFQTMECMQEKNDSIVNLHITKDGIRFFWKNDGTTMCIIAFINQSYFSTFEFVSPNGEDIVKPLDITLVCRDLKRFQLSHVETLEFNSGDHKINVIGIQKERGKQTETSVSIICSNQKIDEVNVGCEYPVTFRVSFSSFVHIISSMISVFRMRVNLNTKMLEFKESTEMDCYETCLPIDDSVIQKMEQHGKTVSEYSEFFRRSMFFPILKWKSAGQNQEIQLSFVKDKPLLCEIILKEKSPDYSASKISVLITPTCDEDEEEEEEEEEEE